MLDSWFPNNPNIRASLLPEEKFRINIWFPLSYVKTPKQAQPFIFTWFLLSDLAAADRRGHVGGGGPEGSWGEEDVPGGQVPRPLRPRLYAVSPGKPGSETKHSEKQGISAGLHFYQWKIEGVKKCFHYEIWCRYCLTNRNVDPSTPPLCLLACSLLFIPHSQELCRKLHKQIDLVDEERYDMELKVKKSNKEVDQISVPSFLFAVPTHTDLSRCFLFLDRWPEVKGSGSEREVFQEAGPKEGADVSRRHAGRSAGLQTQSLHGSEVQPEAGQEGAERGGGCFIQNSIIYIKAQAG